jgi:4-amino-4-deoxy-L-arabinose transferase-like glycosyltransferase
MIHRSWIWIPTIFWAPLVCILLNVTLSIWIVTNRPGYLRDSQLNEHPDAQHYVLLGRNILLLGEYSRRSEAPYVADAFRTPGYPLFAGALDIIGGAVLIYLIQALLQAITCIVIFSITKKLFGDKAALIASLLCATDVMCAVLNFQAMSEVVYVFLLSISALVLLPCILGKVKGRASSFLFGGLLLGLATHVRPAGLYLPLVYVIAILAVGLLKKLYQQCLVNAILVISGSMLLLMPWIVRNWVVFGMPRLTTNDTIVLVYFAGAGAYQFHHEVDLQTAQRMITQEFGLRPPQEMWNSWTSDFSQKEMDDQARSVMPAILGKYPLDLIKASAIGILKASVSHNTGDLAFMLGKEWRGPELGRVLRFDPVAISRLFGNHIGLILVFTWEVLHAALVLMLAGFGLLWIVRIREQRMMGFILLFLVSFFVGILGISGLEAYARFRSPIMPLAYVAAGTALAMIFSAARRGCLPAVVPKDIAPGATAGT